MSSEKISISENLGCVKDVKIKLEVDSNLKPVRQPIRPVAIHLRDAIEKELMHQGCNRHGCNRACR